MFINHFFDNKLLSVKVEFDCLVKYEIKVEKAEYTRNWPIQDTEKGGGILRVPTVGLNPRCIILRIALYSLMLAADEPYHLQHLTLNTGRKIIAV